MHARPPRLLHVAWAFLFSHPASFTPARAVPCIAGSALGSDTIVEVARGPLIPGFAAVKAAAVRS